MSHYPSPSRLDGRAIAGVMSLGLVACGGSDNSSSSGDLTIGASIPLTGEFSQQGKAAEQGYKVWQAMVNANGGLLGKQVKLVIKDDASDQNTVVSDYNALISQDKVDLLLGTYSSLLNLPASAVAEKNKMLYVSPPAGRPTCSAAASSTSSSPSRPRPTSRAWLRRLGRGPPGRAATQDRRLPDARRPVRGAERRGHP